MEPAARLDRERVPQAARPKDGERRDDKKRGRGERDRATAQPGPAVTSEDVQQRHRQHGKRVTLGQDRHRE